MISDQSLLILQLFVRKGLKEITFTLENYESKIFITKPIKDPTTKI